MRYRSMKYRLAAVPLLLCGVMSAQFSGNHVPQSISGQVRTASGQPAPEVRIEVHDLLTGSTVATAYTSEAGNFEVDNVDPGNYDVIALSGTSQASERV